MLFFSPPSIRELLDAMKGENFWYGCFFGAAITSSIFLISSSFSKSTSLPFSGSNDPEQTNPYDPRKIMESYNKSKYIDVLDIKVIKKSPENRHRKNELVMHYDFKYSGENSITQLRFSVAGYNVHDVKIATLEVNIGGVSPTRKRYKGITEISKVSLFGELDESTRYQLESAMGF